ncbi:XopZ family type III secretion system effector [Paracidovorax anthurii]|uniref:Uncharacterized protein n=1 Tax=Paracidovorax anthurii TaxID=78229 RepID=A0A328ZTE8_9BURK|nr:XopZ family type III secretion system effector [Paracidovorax anthurii]RAR86147.1 hypothetical protein AX018_1002108 [Paracidovorax anthurii]
MSKFSLRPRNFTLLIPGNSQNVAHAGKPEPGKQAHHKLHQIDPALAQREALSPHFGVAARVRKYLEDPLPESPPAEPVPEPSCAPRPRAPVKTLRRYLGKAGTMLGMRAGKPVAQSELTRYQNSPSASDRPIGKDDAKDQGTWRSEGAAQARAFAAAEHHHQADVAAKKAAALEHLVLLHIERLDGEMAEDGTRAAHTTKKAHGLRHQQSIRTALHQSLDREIATSRQKVAVIEQQIEQVRLTLDSTKVRRGSLGELLSRTSDADPPPAAEDPHALQATLGELKARLARQLDRQQALERRCADTQGELEQLERTATIIARDLLQADGEATDLRSLLPALAQRRETLEAALDAARTADEAAAAALKDRGQEIIDQQVETLPGLDANADPAAATELRKTLRGWTEGLDKAAFGANAIAPSGVLAVGLKAFAIAAGGDPAEALQAFDALRSHGWDDLIPPPAKDGTADIGGTDLPPAARRAVDLLARVPRGLQVLAHLLRPEDSPAASPERLAAARLALRADHLLRNAAPEDAALRQWLGHARNAARAATHAPQPAQALAACTVDERAAYHALRNGYESNAPGSPYERANSHLQRIADALHDVEHNGIQPQVFGGQPNALRSLPEALEVGSATALPTPSRRADEALEKASGQLGEMLSGLRAGMPAGHIPSGAERAWRAIAETIQWAPEGTDRTTMVLDDAALAQVRERAKELHAQFIKTAREHGATPTEGGEQPALQAAWKRLRSRPHTVPEALSMLDSLMREQPPQTGSPVRTAAGAGPSPVSWNDYAQQHGTQFGDAVREADRLLRDGDPGKVTHGQALFDLTRDMVSQLEWRDRLRLIGQQTWGVNTGPVSAAMALGASVLGMGMRLNAAMQHNQDSVMEFYMGRTGMYLQIGEQKTTQIQMGAGASTGYAVDLGTETAALGITGAADWRWRGERGVENGIQLRLPRLGKGREPELNVEFLDFYEHFIRLATPNPDGTPARKDWLHELLAHHPELSAGLIDDAQRSSMGTETNASISVGVRVGEVADKGRRAGVAASAGLKMRQDNGQTATTVAGYMTTIYRDATATARVEVSGRATASVQFVEALEDKPSGNGTTQRASASLSGLDAGYARELSAHATTNFCTLFLFGDEIDPVRSDRATDYSKFGDFERHVRAEWDGWAQYGTGKLGDGVDETLHHLLADIQLSHFMKQTKAFAHGNGFAAMFADKAMRAPAAPLLDVHRALASLARESGDTEGAQAEDAAFDALLQEEAMWEPTLLLLREKGKLQAERGVDFFIKHQNNRGAEAMRTVAQWIPYEPVLRRELDQELKPARTWDAPPEPHTEAPRSPAAPASRSLRISDENDSSSRYSTASSGSLESFRSANSFLETIPEEEEPTPPSGEPAVPLQPRS